MCGIAGEFGHRASSPQARSARTERALARIRHRGPDQFGVYADPYTALGNARLSIVDLASGQQPISNEDDTLWIVFNGEIFNHVELRPGLEARGHRFKTRADTEVILHLYEDYGPDCLQHLNGQFAIAIWDTRRQELFLARDRLGVRPLFYARTESGLVFASEIKALQCHPEVSLRLDPVALDQVFTLWCPVAPRTAFLGVQQLPPGHWMRLRGTDCMQHRFWEPRFPAVGGTDIASQPEIPLGDAVQQLRELLIDAARIRLRADVTVGAYLSGGLDSSLITSIIRHHTATRLQTFSIGFTDGQFDESQFQKSMASYLDTEHHVVTATHADIGAIFPQVLWHTEIPTLRTAPAPMFLLSKLVHQHGLKVVLTGEGADEYMAGYDIFKEDKIRRFWAREPGSRWRWLLFRRLYPEISGLGASNAGMLAAFFKSGFQDTQSREYSHAVRWKNNRRTTRFFSEGFQRELQGSEWMGQLPYPPGYDRWGPLERAQFLEQELFMSQYLLSSQGDRVGMAHSVEGRFPFLDVRVVEFCNQLPSRYKLRGLREKHILREVARGLLPGEILNRRKRPYRAPIHKCFLGAAQPDYINDLLSESRLKQAGVFEPAAVMQLRRKVSSGAAIGETDDMAIAGIVSTQLCWESFIAAPPVAEGLRDSDDVRRCVFDRPPGPLASSAAR